MISYIKLTLNQKRLVSMNVKSLSSNLVRSTLKDLLKKHDMKYKDFGKLIGLSEGSVKQLMTRGQFTLDRLELIAQRFGLTLIEFLNIAYEKKKSPTRISISDEVLLVEQPYAILLMFLLGSGFSITEAKDRLRLDEKKFQKIVHLLDRIGIIELHSKGRISLKARAPYRFNKDGLIEKKLRPGYIQFIKENILYRPESSTFQKTFEMYASEKLYSQMTEELRQFIEKYSHLARIEAELDEKGKTFPVTGLLFLKELDGWGSYIRSLK